MTEKEFYKLYWAPFKQIEDEFIRTFKYVDLTENNFNTNSSKFLKLILQIGSEVDICLNLYCNMFKKGNYKSIKQYSKVLVDKDFEFKEEKILIKNYDMEFQPWEGLFIQPINVKWWKIYNKIKHNRTGYLTINGITKKTYLYATLENVLISLGALYIVLMNIFSKIKNNRDESPIPGSKIYKLTSSRWKNCKWFSLGYISLNSGKIYLDNTKEWWF